MTQAQREIILPYAESAPVTAVRNLLIQSSLAALKEHGHYERYVTQINPASLQQLSDYVAPSWVPVDLAMRHYEACEKLGLTSAQIDAMGRSTGERLQSTTLVSSAKKHRDPNIDVWSLEAPMHRMWQRLYLGGGVQVVKLGPKEKLVEQRGFPMNRIPYYRAGLINALASAHIAVGIELSSVELEHYDLATDEAAYRVAWL